MSKDVQHPGSSNAAEAKDDRAQKPIQKCTKDVSDIELDTCEHGRLLETTTKLVGKTASTLTQNEQSLNNTTKVAKKVPMKEVRINNVVIVKSVV